MGGFGRKVAAGAAAAFAAITLSGCAAYQGIEPVVMPPSNYQADNAVKVEFVHPAMVGVRCAERGVTFLGMPGVNSGACADDTLITMPNPCFSLAGGWYASVMCHELAHTNGWAHDHRGGSLMAQAPIQPARLSAAALQHEAAMQARASENRTRLLAAKAPVAKPVAGKAQTVAAVRPQRRDGAVSLTPVAARTAPGAHQHGAHPFSLTAAPTTAPQPDAAPRAALTLPSVLPQSPQVATPTPSVFNPHAAVASLRVRLND